MNYSDSVHYLYSIGNESKTLKLGLERIQALLFELGQPQQAFPSIHVAGTNGKGSTCAMIESGLRAAGLRTGLFTSPHLIEPTERIRIDGSDVSPARFADAFARTHATASRMVREGRLDGHPSYFETVTAMAFLLFRDAGVDKAVVEVGLGGRLDATNVLLPELSVITPVDFDHQAYLGDTLELIAREKAGILKPGVPSVFAAQRPEAAGVLQECASLRNSEITRTVEYNVSDLRLLAESSRFTAERRQSLHIECPLAGEHQVENALAAIASLELLGIEPKAIEQGIASAVWPGRLEVLARQPDLIVDGAHNPAGARALANHIQRFYGNRPVWLIYGAMRDKAVSEITRLLFSCAHRVILTAPRMERAVPPEALAELTAHPCKSIAPDCASALQQASEAPPGTAIFITGSLYLAGEARALLVQ